MFSRIKPESPMFFSWKIKQILIGPKGFFLSLKHMKKQEPPETSRWNRGSFFSWKPDLSPIYTISRDLTDPNAKREITELYLHDIYLAFLGRPMGFSYHITYSTSVLPNKLGNGFKYTDNWVKYARNLTKYVIIKILYSIDRQWRPRERPLRKTPEVGLQGSDWSFQGMERPLRPL